MKTSSEFHGVLLVLTEFVINLQLSRGIVVGDKIWDINDEFIIPIKNQRDFG